MKILIPAAGGGRRFAEAGYTFPKPLLDVRGKPMIQRVVENLDFPDAEYIFLVQQEHIEKWNIDKALMQLGKHVSIIPVDGITEGAACTALLAKEVINNDEELIIANSDQLLDFSRENFDTMREWTPSAGIIFVFHGVHPKWSFARLDSCGAVCEVAEKRPISNVATCGVYYYRFGYLFVEAAENMIRLDDRTNGEYYIAPAYNYIIQRGIRGGGAHHQVLPFFVERMHGLGTPEDLEQYLRHVK